MSPPVDEPWGYWRCTIGGVDVSRFRGAPFNASFQLLEPFGCGEASIVLPKLTPLDVLDAGDQEWTDPGSPVDIFRLDGDAETVDNKWSGEIIGRQVSVSGTSGRITLMCVGDMESASLQMWQPRPSLDPVDIGHQIASALNSVIGRRYHAIEPVTTGILTSKRGSDDMTIMAYCQELLGDAVTSSGNQWTVNRTGRRTYAIQLKDRTTANIVMTAGQPGVDINLTLDASKVASRIFGSGVTRDGFSWSNMLYPGSRPDDAPGYPFSDPSETIDIGDSGSGVETWQRRANELNITSDLAVDGVYNTSDANAARIIQRHYGLTVDGIVGPQTWAATFDVGGGAELGSMLRRPLARIDAVEPRLYNADGSDAGANPTFDPSLLLVDRDINFGPGVSKKQGFAAAENLMLRDFPPGMAGDIAYSADPAQMSRYDITPGMNIELHQLKGFDGVDPYLLHIAGVDVDTDGPVRCAVDSRAHDLATIVELRANREQAVNPVLLPKNRRDRRSSQTRDAVVPFDGESRGGIIPKFALFSGLWSVIRIPVAQSGRIAKTYAKTEGPASAFAMAIFGAPITPSDLLGTVGNPLTSDNPWEPHKAALDGWGWVEGWGSSESKCGVNRSDAVTGVFEDEGTLEFRSLHPPILWVAFYATTACRISGRLYPAPMDA